MDDDDVEAMRYLEALREQLNAPSGAVGAD